MGGDLGCGVVVDGLLQALKQCEKIEKIQIVGDEKQIEQTLKHLDKPESRLEVVHASEILSMEDKPVEGLRKNKLCSLAVAMYLVKPAKRML